MKIQKFTSKKTKEKIRVRSGEKKCLVWLMPYRQNLAGEIEFILEEGAELKNIILFSAAGKDRHELNFSITHIGANSFSNTAIYAIARDRSSISALGSARVLKNAKYSDVWLEGRALLFDDASCRMDPRLEVETSDVERAGHAATVSRISDEDLFYMASRGVGLVKAERLKIGGFLSAPLLRAGLSTKKAEKIINQLLV